MMPAEQDALSYTDMWKIRRMRECLKEHKLANELLSGNGKDQLSIVWIDEETGIKCKARIDRLTAFGGFSCHVDLKTARSADPASFMKDAAKLGYFEQAAHYRAGCEAIDKMEGRPVRHRRFIFLVIEKETECGDKFRIEVYEPTEDDIERAGVEIRRLMKIYANCLETKVWPYRPTRVRPLTMPQWRVEEIEALGGID